MWEVFENKDYIDRKKQSQTKKTEHKNLTDRDKVPSECLDVYDFLVSMNVEELRVLTQEDLIGLDLKNESPLIRRASIQARNTKPKKAFL